MPHPAPDHARAWGPPGARGDGPWGPPWLRSDLDPERRRHLRAVALTFPAAVLAVIVLGGSTAADHFSTPPRQLDVLGRLLLLVAPAALPLTALGRRVGAVAALAAAAAAGLYLLLGYPFGPAVLPLVVLAVVLGAGGRRVLSWTVAGLGVAAVVARAVTDADARPTALVVWTTALVVGGLLGEGLRGRGERVRAVQAARVSREEAAATAERLRIARELHDVLAHSLSGISVQAGVGLHLMDREPEQAREALRRIRTTSVEALDEVREVLGILRSEGEAPPRSPATTTPTDAVPGLLDAARAAGIAVTEALDAAALTDLEPDRATVLVRALQESLTNVRRHAGDGVRADVRVSALAGGGVRLEVVDDGGVGAEGGSPPTGRAPGQTAGFGLRGMRERVEALGGTVDAGPRGDGWAVVVELPQRSR